MNISEYLKSSTTVQAKYSDDNEWVIECDCDRKSGSERYHLWVNVTKSQGICYRCGKKLGSMIDIIMHVDRISRFDAILKYRDGTPPTKRLDDVISSLLPDVDPEYAPTASVSLPDDFIPYKAGGKVPKYLKARGLTRVDCETYGIGWCTRGWYRRRLIIPIYDSQGDLLSFAARYLGDPPDKVQKVLYPKGSKTSKVLFNSAMASESGTIIVTEGVFDAIRVGTNAVALLGKNASSYQKRELSILGTDRTLFIMLDSDARRDAVALGKELNEVCFDVRVCRLPKARKDPGECTPEEIRESLRKAKVFGSTSSKLKQAIASL